MHPKPLVRCLLWAFWVLSLAFGVAEAVADLEPAKPQGHETVLPSGVRYVDEKPGTGEEARDGKILDVRYTGWLQDGSKFDSTEDCAKPLTLRLGAGDVIKGLDEGLVGMKVGGKRHLTIPPELGFGKEGGGERIPPNATLIYEVELLAVR
jgi:FKBP-type peptidyl-prolyl cis-trans isomerase